MTPKAMLNTPVAERRGAVTQESGSWGYLLVGEDADSVLDGLLAAAVIGAARRDCFADVRAGEVLRPVGPWGMLVRLRGQPWTYVLGDGLRYEWPRAWAARHGWRVAWFSLDGMMNMKVARLYDGGREVFNFVSSITAEPEEGSHFREKLAEESAVICGEDAGVCSRAWLEKLESGGQAMDLLARRAGAYLPVSLGYGDDEGRATVGGWDGDPFYGDNDGPHADFDDADFERVDVFTFGGPETLTPSAASLALAAALRSADAGAVRAALVDAADPDVMAGDDEAPLHLALGYGNPFSMSTGGRYSEVSREQQLDVMAVLLHGGATPDLPGREPAIHRVLERGGDGDERTIVRQLRPLLDCGADPNALGTDMRSSGQRPLHAAAAFHGWPAVLKLLLLRGADPALTNRAGRTPRAEAEERLAYLTRTHDPVTAPPNDGSTQRAMSKMLAAAMAADDERREKEVGRLRESIAVLAEAERGEADLSDVDALAEASWLDYSAEQERRRAEVDALKAQWNCTDDESPAERRERSRLRREQRARDAASEN